MSAKEHSFYASFELLNGEELAEEVNASFYNTSEGVVIDRLEVQELGNIVSLISNREFTHLVGLLEDSLVAEHVCGNDM